MNGGFRSFGKRFEFCDKAATALVMHRKRIIRLIWIFIIGAIAVYFLAGQISKNLPLISPQVKNNSLKVTIENALADTKGTYSVVVKNLKTGESYYLNEHQSFPAGSLYKLWVMATVYNQIQNKQLEKDQVLSQDISVLNKKFSIDPNFAEQTEGTISLTVSDALNQMITISHNYAALLLTEKIKLSAVAMFLKDQGFNESSVGTNGGAPATTASDISMFLEKLYKGQLANEENTKDMIELLKKQQLNDGIPKYLPDKSKVASKTGDIDMFKHDAGIIFSDKGDYVLVVLSESDSPLGAQERIAEVSKAIYQYFLLR